MSDLSGVPIEPKEQTTLLDACGQVKGVVGGGVPGGTSFLISFFHNYSPNLHFQVSIHMYETTQKLMIRFDLAGGYDALYLLTIDHPTPLAGVDELWADWTEMDVCPLSSKQSDGGIRQEEVAEVKGLKDALDRARAGE